jgi:predicted nucleotidyltransferase
MRLSDLEKQQLVESVTKRDSMAQIYLFGSRTDDAKRGGDFDFLVLSSALTSKDRRAIKREFCDAFGEQKIDLIITSEPQSAFHRMAINTGIKL